VRAQKFERLRHGGHGACGRFDLGTESLQGKLNNAIIGISNASNQKLILLLLSEILLGLQQRRKMVSDVGEWEIQAFQCISEIHVYV
jgi:hypothetical protein